MTATRTPTCRTIRPPQGAAATTRPRRPRLHARDAVHCLDSAHMAIRIVDVTDDASFLLVPPCADPGFDHRSCDYWEDADHGSKAARLSWLTATGGKAGTSAGAAKSRPANPFLADLEAKEPIANP